MRLTYVAGPYTTSDLRKFVGEQSHELTHEPAVGTGLLIKTDRGQVSGIVRTGGLLELCHPDPMTNPYVRKPGWKP
jgi:hypothetical protein